MHWGLSFAGTAALLALTYTMVSDRATWLAAAVAGCAAVAAFALPLRLNILVAIAAAVAVGVVLDHTMPTSHAPRPLEGATRMSAAMEHWWSIIVAAWPPSR